jgi:hypothetical protein
MAFHRILSFTDIAITVSAQVICNRSVEFPNDAELRLPHHMTEGKSVHENYRHPRWVADVDVIERIAVKIRKHGTF